MTGKERWLATCDDCLFAKAFSTRSIAIGQAAVHERNKGHTVQVRDLFDTDHRLPDELRSQDTGSDRP